MTDIRDKLRAIAIKYYRTHGHAPDALVLDDTDSDAFTQIAIRRVQDEITRGVWAHGRARREVTHLRIPGMRPIELHLWSNQETHAFARKR